MAEKTSRIPSEVPVYATSLFSRSNTTTFVISVLSALIFTEAKLRIVADAADADGVNGGETMTR